MKGKHILFEKLSRCAVLVSVSMSLAACELPNPEATYTLASLPAVSKNMARVIVFRAGGSGFGNGGMYKLSAAIDGKEVSKCRPDSAVYVDIPAGKHRITGKAALLYTKPEKMIEANLQSGSTTYIRCDTTMDTMLRIFLFERVIDPSTDLRDRKYLHETTPVRVEFAR